MARGISKEDTVRQLMGKDYAHYKFFRDSKWVGPFTVAQLLDNCMISDFPRPPESNSVYLVSKDPWQEHPDVTCCPLYVGSNTGRGERFRTRIGDLIADMFGFFQDQSGHSSGGKSLYWYCKDKGLNPKQLHIAWLARCGCTKCAEHCWWEDLNPELNLNSPPCCKEHAGDDRYLAVVSENPLPPHEGEVDN